MGHIPREISCHCDFFMEEGGNITGHLISTTHKVSPVPIGGLEVLLLLACSVESERIFKLMKNFVNDLYDLQTENNKEECGDDEEIDIKLTGEENTIENNENVIEKD